MQISYRPEIDGLRTVAVLAVIIYHAQFIIGGDYFLKGGFFGVDVFFVISGFLITSIIMKELHVDGTFSFLGFYERRARRILPALFLVILVALPFAWYLLLPTQLNDFAKSILSTLLFGSNFYWFDSLQQYGAESALLKPLLHTWSLAVEEQYYIIFPIILIVIYKWFKRYTVVLLTAGLLLSLGLSDYVTSKDQSFSFYMLPTRFWELLAGSLLANILYFHPQKDNDAFLNKTMPILGLYLIGYSLFFVSFESNHPGYVTLLPVIGTVLVIWFANEKDLVTQILSSRLFVGVGLISYSLYLWHYPIFAFGRIIDPSPSWQVKTVWIILTVVLSIVGFFLVERPTRDRKKVSFKFLVVSIVLVASIIFAALYIFLENKIVGHASTQLDQIYGDNEPDNQILRKQSWKLLDNIHHQFGYKERGRVRAKEASLSEKNELWFSDSQSHKILIIGDSHAKDLFNAFYQNKELFEGFEFARYGIAIVEDRELLNELISSPNFKAADSIILSQRFGSHRDEDRLESEEIRALPEFLSMLLKTNKEIILASNTPEFLAYSGYKNVFDGYLRNVRHHFNASELGELYYRLRNPLIPSMNHEIELLADRVGVKYVDKLDYVCDVVKKQCDGVTDKGKKSFYDDVHYTIEGARYFGKKMFEIGWLESILHPQAD